MAGTANTAASRGHRFTAERYSDGWEHVLYCTLCGFTEAGDSAGHRFALDHKGRVIQPAKEMAVRLLAPCPNPARKVTKFRVANDADLDIFKGTATLALIAANPTGWPVIKLGFDQLIALSRAVLRID